MYCRGKGSATPFVRTKVEVCVVGTAGATTDTVCPPPAAGADAVGVLVATCGLSAPPPVPFDAPPRPAGGALEFVLSPGAPADVLVVAVVVALVLAAASDAG